MFVYVTRVESGGVSHIASTFRKADVSLPSAVMERRCQSLAYISGFHAMFNDFE